MKRPYEKPALLPLESRTGAQMLLGGHLQRRLHEYEVARNYTVLLPGQSESDLMSFGEWLAEAERPQAVVLGVRLRRPARELSWRGRWRSLTCGLR